MGKFNLNLPNDLHDKLRIEKVNRKKDISQIIIIAIKKELKIGTKNY